MKKVKVKLNEGVEIKNSIDDGRLTEYLKYYIPVVIGSLSDDKKGDFFNEFRKLIIKYN